jgi:ABC-2 type transport system ATP-binding protein
MSTHDIFRARQLADRIGIMRGGRKVAELERDELERTDLEALYLDIMRSGEGAATHEEVPQEACAS